MTPIDKALNALRGAGIDAREAAAYTGKCRAGYAVVYSGGDEATGPTTRRILINILLHVPASKPEGMKALRANADAAMLRAGFKRRGAGEDGVLENYEAITGLTTWYLLGGI